METLQSDVTLLLALRSTGLLPELILPLVRLAAIVRRLGVPCFALRVASTPVDAFPLYRHITLSELNQHAALFVDHYRRGLIAVDHTTAPAQALAVVVDSPTYGPDTMVAVDAPFLLIYNSGSLNAYSDLDRKYIDLALHNPLPRFLSTTCGQSWQKVFILTADQGVLLQGTGKFFATT